MPADPPPLTPSPGEARQWLLHELSKPEYTAAKPSWFDLLSQRILRWFDSLHIGASGSGGVWLAVAGVVVLAAIVVGAIVLYGVPRRNRRRAAEASGVLDAGDARTAAQLRAAAERAAARGDWSLAVIERFRGVSVALDERTIVLLLPGATSHGIAAQASNAFPDAAAALRDAAELFDAVRYAGAPADADDYARLRALDEALRRAPVRLSGVQLEGAGR